MTESQLRLRNETNTMKRQRGASEDKLKGKHSDFLMPAFVQEHIDKLIAHQAIGTNSGRSVGVDMKNVAAAARKLNSRYEK